jgi:membrane protein|tara:strand:- start:38253 stop:39149 length:897 start_codon:yes stop_codon:yes gene_type:complete
MFKNLLKLLSPLFVFQLMKNTFQEFFKEKSFFHGAALAYYAIFAMVPMLYLAVNYVGMIFGNKFMIEIITEVLQSYVGIDDVSGILKFLDGVNFEKSSFVLNAIGIAALLLSSTALLNSLRSSINEFYDIEPEYHSSKRMILMTLITKLISIVFLTAIGLVIIIFYFAETIFMSISSDWLSEFHTIQWLFESFLHHAISIGSNVIIFMFMFKFLHDGIIKWRLSFYGAIFTSGLLYLGQMMINFYISNYFFGSSAGLAGTLLVILLWMYYSSQIIFLGAKFTKVLGDMLEMPILNRKY